MVPGQVINAQTIEFMRKLDVKEIHGFTAALGLKLLNPAFLQFLKAPVKASTNAAKHERPTAARSASGH
jgi:arginine decarboxylase